MLIFVSSTYRDLKDERLAVQTALQAGEAAPWGMEFFHSQPDRPLKVCLDELRQCSAIVLILGFRGGSLVSENPGLTYTAAEIEEARKFGIPVFVFVKTENGSWRNDEPAGPVRKALDDFESQVLATSGTVSFFENLDQLRFEVLASLKKWTEMGRPGARKTFVSRQDYFAPYEQPTHPGRLFDYRQKLEGRTDELQALDRFLSDPHQIVALMPGRGGIGKTKILYDWTSAVTGFNPLFLPAAAVWHPESDKEIPSGDVLIVADDAHRLQEIPRLLLLFQQLAQNPARRVKLLLSTRPSGTLALRSSLARTFEPSQILEFPTLERLSRKDVRALAAEQLGPDYAHLRDWLVSLSLDTPLVTAIAARLIGSGRLKSADFTNEVEFRRAVFDRFIEEYTTALPNCGFPWRKLVDLLAAVGPTQPRTDAFLSAAETFLRLPRHEISQALDQLEANGLLIREEDRVHIAPDALGDFLLEDACVNSRGETTGYADAVFASFRNEDLRSLLSNLAELDWRLEQKNSTARVLQRVWTEIESEFSTADAAGRCETLAALRGAAMFQPDQTLRIIRCAMDTIARPGSILDYWETTQADVVEELPNLLGTLAHIADHIEEAVRRLFALAQLPSDRLDPKAIKVLRDLASYKLHKSVAFLLHLADTAANLAREPGAFRGSFTPLDIADELLKREVRHEEFQELTFRIGSIPLNHAVVAPLRDKALEMIEESLNAPDPMRTDRAVKSSASVLGSFAPIVGRKLTEAERVWQDQERLRVLDMIEARIHRSDTPVQLLRQIKNRLRQHRKQHHSEEFNDRIRGVAEAIPDSEELASFDAFCTPSYEWRFEVKSLSDRDKVVYETVESAVARFSAVHSTIDEKLAELERMSRAAEEYQIGTNESASAFIEVLCRDRAFRTAFVEHVLASPNPRLGFQIRVVLPHLRTEDPAEYSRVGSACASRTSGEVAWGTAQVVCFSRGLDSPIAEDVPIIGLLAVHPDPNVRKLALDGARRLGRSRDLQDAAIAIIAGTDLAGSSKLGEAMAEAFGSGGLPFVALSRDQVQTILNWMLQIDRFDEPEFDTFFANVGEHFPDLLFGFFLERLRRYANTRIGRHRHYSHWGNTLLRTYFGKSPLPGAALQMLRDARDLLSSEDFSLSWVAEIFWVFGDAEGVASQALQEWLDSTDSAKVQLAKYLEEANREHQDGGDEGVMGSKEPN